MIQLSKEIPILNNRWVDTLLQYTLVEGLTISSWIVWDVLANIRIYYVVEVVVVRCWVVIIVLREPIQQLFLLIIELFMIGRHIGQWLLTLDSSSAIRVDQFFLDKQEEALHGLPTY